jgi:hypothetical protein
MNTQHHIGAYGPDQGGPVTFGSVAGTAFLCRVSERLIRAGIDAGTVRTARHGSKRLVCLEDVERLAAAGEGGAR